MASESGTSKSTSPATRGTTSLSTDMGTTSIDDAVVSKIAGIAAREISGVHRLGGSVSGALASVVSRIRGDEHATAGVGVEVGQKQAAVDLTMIVEYPATIHEVAQSVRENVADRIESMTGLEVVEVNVGVTDLFFPGEEDEPEESGRVE